MNTINIDEIVEAFDTEVGICLDSEDIVIEHSSSIADMIKRWGQAEEVSRGVHVWYKRQSRKGDPRKTIVAMEIGSDLAVAAL